MGAWRGCQPASEGGTIHSFISGSKIGWDTKIGLRRGRQLERRLKRLLPAALGGPSADYGRAYLLDTLERKYSDAAAEWVPTMCS